jgi:hypothetical protein
MLLLFLPITLTSIVANTPVLSVPATPAARNGFDNPVPSSLVSFAPPLLLHRLTLLQ